MKINKETKVGILTLVALGLLIAGFNFLKGRDVFNRTKKIYAVFDKLGALAKSNEVKINGLTIGSVYDMEETDKNVSGIKVTISLSRDINIPSNSVAYISAPIAGLGSSTILIEKGDATTYLKDGDIINTRIDEGLLGGLTSEVAPTLAKIRNALDSLNRVFGNINKLFDSDTKGNLQSTIANLNTATRSLSQLMDSKNGPVAQTLDNVNSITGNFRKNNDSITAIINNTKRFTDQLSAMDLKQTMDTLQSAIVTLKSTIGKIASNEGSLGALINDRQLYDKLNDVLLSSEILLDDLRTHPKRYVNFSIFGKKDKGGALTSPSKKDTIPQ
ncbi:MAG: MCE family protein [Chitinophagaceae bacterium]|nr:MCE family protein [Chitinophagaceae bacterium]